MSQNQQNPHAEAYGRVIEILTHARTFIGEELSAEGLSFIRTSLDADLRKMQNKLAAMGNLHISSSIAPVAGTAPEDHGPVTNILGQEITPRQPITTTQVDVSDNERAAFLRKRQDLLERFQDDMVTDDQLINFLQMKANDIVLRAVARKVGVVDYREAELNIEFFQRVRDAVQAYYQKQAFIQEADMASERLKESEENESTTKEMLTDGLLDNGGQPGDSLTDLSNAVANDEKQASIQEADSKEQPALAAEQQPKPRGRR